MCVMRVRRLVVVHFWAPWSQPCKQMNDVMVELAEEHPGVRFIRVGVGRGGSQWRAYRLL